MLCLCSSFDCFLSESALPHALLVCFGCQWGERVQTSGTVGFYVHSDQRCLFFPKVLYLHQYCSVFALLLTVFYQNQLYRVLWWVGLGVGGVQGANSGEQFISVCTVANLSVFPQKCRIFINNFPFLLFL
jgi:hypothetical protein